jgi:APA family basic amino acid/polyamine antiporter
MKQPKTKNTKLKRELGLGLLTFYGLGNIVGAGIYVLIGKVVGESGSNAPLSFIVAGVIAALTAFSYAELSSRYPVAEGASNYIYQAFKIKFIPVLIGMGMVLAGSTSSAALINGMVGYISEIVKLNSNLTIIVIIAGLALILYSGIKQSAVIASILTLIEVTGLIAIIIFGYLKSGIAPNIEAFNPAAWDLSLVSITISGSFLAIYAYFGFEDMVDVVEEVKNPRKTMPRALIISLVGATVLYLLVLGVAMGNVATDQLISSNAPLKTVFSAVTKLNPNIIVVAGIIAAGNGIIVNAVMGSRILYGLSERRMLPRGFTKLSSRAVPTLATFIVLSLITILAIFFPLVTLAKFTSLIVLGVFVLVNASLLKLKMGKSKIIKNEYRVNAIIPAMGFLSSLSLLMFEVLKLLGNL